MNLWNVDAGDISDDGSFDKSLLYRTPLIDDFLVTKRDNLFFVTAPKGLGKTFVLKAKSILYIRDGIPMIHANILADKPGAGNIIFSKKKINLFSNIENWTNLWTLSIYIAVIKRLNKESEVIGSSSIVDFLLSSHAINITSIFKIILGLSPSDFFLAVDALNNVIAPFVESHNSVLAAFIDNVDEYFEKHISSSAVGPSVGGEVSKDIWYLSQMGLIESIYQITSKNPHLKLFASIRREVFLRVSETDSRSLQYKGSGIELSYTKEQIKDIFILNIGKEKNERLFYPELRDKNPIMSFLGIDTFSSRYVEGKSEKAFDYLYRHTLQRPRDLMLIGRKISQTMVRERTVEILQELVNATATEIAQQYIVEISPHMDYIDYEKFFKLIDSNILTRQKLKDICSNYNGDLCNGKKCKECVANHVFCGLYSVGLLGYVADNLVTKEKVQKFLPSGLKSFDYKSKLPESDYYLIHPCLYGLILSFNIKNFKPNRTNIVAPGYKFDKSIIADNKNIVSKGQNVFEKLPRHKWVTHVHFGAGKLGIGLVVPIFQKNSRVVIIQRPSDQWKYLKGFDFIDIFINDSLIGRYDLIHEYAKGQSIDLFLKKWNSRKNLFLCIKDESVIKNVLLASNSISTALGAGVNDIIKYFNGLQFNPSVNLYPFENNGEHVQLLKENLYTASSGLNIVSVVADKICSERVNIDNKLIVKAELYEQVIVDGATKTVTKIMKTFKGVDIVKIVTVKSEYEFFYKRKFYIVNGVHMIAAIYGYLYLYEKKIQYDKWSEYSLNVLLDNASLYGSFVGFISIQSVRIIIEMHEKDDNQMLDYQSKYNELVIYGNKVLERFRESADQIVRILNINDIKRLETSYKARVQGLSRFVKDNIVKIDKLALSDNISSADMLKIVSELNDKTSELFLQIIKNYPV